MKGVDKLTTSFLDSRAHEPVHGQSSAGNPRVAESSRGGARERSGSLLALGPRTDAMSQQAAPRPAVVRWPDGRKSNGEVFVQTSAADAALLFRAKNDDGVVKKHKAYSKAGQSPLQAFPVTIGASGKAFVPVFPSLGELGLVVDGKLRVPSFDFVRPRDGSHIEVLASEWRASDIPTVLGAAAERMSYGLTPRQRAGVRQLFANVLETIAARMHDPDAARHCAAALKQPHLLVLEADQNASRTGSAPPAVFSTFDAQTLDGRLTALQAGQHLSIAVDQIARGEGGHAIGIAITKMATDTFRVTILNSEGWTQLPGRKNTDKAAVCKTGSQQQVAEALHELLQPRSQVRPHNVSARNWELQNGSPVFHWLQQMAPDQPMSTLIDGQHAFRQSPQKGYNCGIENEFAFMASHLPAADYKLAKAACLDTLLQIDTLQGDPGDIFTPRNKERLETRTTSAMSGYAATREPEAPDERLSTPEPGSGSAPAAGVSSSAIRQETPAGAALRSGAALKRLLEGAGTSRAGLRGRLGALVGRRQESLDTLIRGDVLAFAKAHSLEPRLAARTLIEALGSERLDPRLSDADRQSMHDALDRIAH